MIWFYTSIPLEQQGHPFQQRGRWRKCSLALEKLRNPATWYHRYTGQSVIFPRLEFCIYSYTQVISLPLVSTVTSHHSWIQNPWIPVTCTKCVQPSSSPVLKHVFPYKDLHGWITKGLNIWNPQKIIVKSDKTTLTSGQIYGQHLGIYWGYGLFLFIGYIPRMVVNISSDLRPDLLVVWSQEAEMSQAPPRREPGRAASAPGLKKFRNRRLMAIDICHGDCISLIIYIEEV